MKHALLSALVVGLLISLVGCGEDKEDNDDKGLGCGTTQNPTPLVVKNIKPDLDATVANKDIQHEFVVVNPPGILSSLNFTFGADHTAGGRQPADLSYQHSASGNEYTYTLEKFRWTNAPAVVSMAHTGVFVDANSCVYSMPDLRFHYNVIADNSQLPDLEYDTNSCLTFAGASELCGAASDGDICQLAATCRYDTNASQCSIDCEMSTTVGCLDLTDVECVWTAFQSQNCDAMGECAGWYLVY
ncbi:MAG: hypothetical protein A2289_04105 [Deltaproteobacteria bacterium RIFOXYA12_FULL_58_15]|nr:MAG: hypothetical protein A2289_04105 [Deltaproteobacteria bacterium RIFOXYA12_FULL_58_15]